MSGSIFREAAPRLYALPPGAPFAEALVAGLADRMGDAPPEAWARITLLVNSGRMARSVRAAFDRGPARLVPRILHVADLAGLAGWPDIPAAMPRLHLVLDLATLLDRLTDSDPSLAPKSAIFDLADSLATLIDEMEGEGVDATALDRVDVAGFAAHWARSRSIVGAAYAHFGRTGGRLPGAEARRRRIVAALSETWRTHPPSGPVIVAGSTGSRGATRALMAAVARLPQGAVVLPGVDTDMPPDHWQAMGDALTGEDHPQYRFLALMRDIEVTPEDLRPWTRSRAPDPARNRLVSLSLCPAPVTDRWRAEGTALGDPRPATGRLTLLEAPNARIEAEVIALRLRKAAEDGQRAALITPDREITRRVAAALTRWGITPDDSGGTPLHQTAPGRLLRMTAALMAEAPTLPELLSLLKHPLTGTGADRGPHLRAVRDLELALRRAAVARPTGAVIRSGGQRGTHTAWAAWLADLLEAAERPDTAPLADLVTTHGEVTAAIAAGAQGTPPGALWEESAGRAARGAMEVLSEAARAESRENGLSARAYGDLLLTHLRGIPVQDPRRPHPDILIWGTLEARAGGVDLAILAGLNDGTWPDTAPPDPWLNRRMRAEAGLLLPERRIGLSAHDYQQAVAAPEAMLTRATRDAEAETVPSRWLNRLTNLLGGLGPEGQEALEAMKARGASWQGLAAALERPDARVPSAPRPAPRPPLEARPKVLSVTRIATLIRDPYDIYARDVLALYKLPPLLPRADQRERGIALHEAMEAFLKDHGTWADDVEAARAALSDAARRHLARHSADAATRGLWHARLMGVADRIVAGEMDRLADARPVLVEEAGRLRIEGTPFTLTARPDRIDRFTDGTYAIRDYKSGAPPSDKVVAAFDKQLPLTAAMVESGAFPGLPAAAVREMTYIALGASGADRNLKVEADGGATLAQRELDGLRRLLAAYARRAQGYTARRAAERTAWAGDYDHLSRYGEWDISDDARPLDVGDPA